MKRPEGGVALQRDCGRTIWYVKFNVLAMNLQYGEIRAGECPRGSSNICRLIFDERTSV